MRCAFAILAVALVGTSVGRSSASSASHAVGKKGQALAQFDGRALNEEGEEESLPPPSVSPSPPPDENDEGELGGSVALPPPLAVPSPPPSASPGEGSDEGEGSTETSSGSTETSSGSDEGEGSTETSSGSGEEGDEGQSSTCCEVMSAQFTLGGDVSDYDTVKQAAIKTVLANAANVSTSKVTLDISSASVRIHATIVLPNDPNLNMSPDDAGYASLRVPNLANILSSTTALQGALQAQPALQAVSVEAASALTVHSGPGGHYESLSGHYPGQDFAPYAMGVGTDTKLAVYVERKSVMTDLVSFSYRELPLAWDIKGPPHKLFLMQRACPLFSKDPESCNVGTRQTGLLTGVPFKYAYSHTQTRCDAALPHRV